MTWKINSYYEILNRLTQHIAVTDKTGRSMDIQSGFEKSVCLLTECGKSDGKLMFIGNGASASISSHMGVDFWKHAGIKATAFNDPSLLTCVSNDYGYDQVFVKPIEMFANKEDILIAISSSGKSINILNAVKAAQSKFVKVITLTGFSESNPLRKSGDINFYVPIDRYSHIEIIHHSICHYILDIIIDEKENRCY